MQRRMQESIRPEVSSGSVDIPSVIPLVTYGSAWLSGPVCHVLHMSTIVCVNGKLVDFQHGWVYLWVYFAR